jgi:hypothetical protein
VGLGRYDADTTTRDAEMSVTVGGRRHRRGIGTLLARALVLLARVACERRQRHVLPVVVVEQSVDPVERWRRRSEEPVAAERVLGATSPLGSRVPV